MGIQFPQLEKLNGGNELLERKTGIILRNFLTRFDSVWGVSTNLTMVLLNPLIPYC
jgi:hypothetical protein